MTGPGPSALISTAIAAITGASATSRTTENVMSIARLSSIVDRGTSHVLYSTTGMSATWFSCTAVPNMPATDGITLTFTCF